MDFCCNNIVVTWTDDRLYIVVTWTDDKLYLKASEKQLYYFANCSDT